MKKFWQQINPIIAIMSAGLMTVIVGFSSSVALIYQSVISLGGDANLVASWFLALGVSMGILSIILSRYYRIPILIAWSTPGAAFLIANAQGFTLHQAVAGFILCAFLLCIFPLLMPLDKLFKWLPSQLASAMLVGILLNFGFSIFEQMNLQPMLIIVMFISYLLGKRFAPQWALLIVILVSVIFAWQLQLIDNKTIEWQWSQWQFIQPDFSWSVFIGISLPLFIITTAAQNLPGIAMLQSFGYQAPIKHILSITGLCNIIAAPFGAYAINLAAISSSICMTENVHPDPKKRYWATIFAGFLYLLLGFFSAYIMAWFALLPNSLILALAGIALFSTITHSLQQSINSEHKHVNEAAVITLLITASPLSLWGLNSVIWGIIGGLLVLIINQLRFNKKAK
ncbi:benzoate/H(+) symporter BenE family transporter [Psychromonas sp. RZ22]|uniref:benzoate/H(+) symporter BenE family transporter n=1 Tax=Psychromonas algarum TaxID=2555643 RepID=UPI0010677C21|nr:benzoate/H(+) symporter BenE family transporter [Psychromonas sp. RZ22]TEW53959.1 benzoate/H(+) symporter BenE family transporter [Psychromonas sp. RZ22]